MAKAAELPSCIAPEPASGALVCAAPVSDAELGERVVVAVVDPVVLESVVVELRHNQYVHRHIWESGIYLSVLFEVDVEDEVPFVVLEDSPLVVDVELSMDVDVAEEEEDELELPDPPEMVKRPL